MTIRLYQYLHYVIVLRTRCIDERLSMSVNRAEHEPFQNGDRPVSFSKNVSKNVKNVHCVQWFAR